MEGINYKDDPKVFLIHEGNKNSGRYPRGSGERPYQHGGGPFRRRKDKPFKNKYVNADGSLTRRGEERFELEKKRNAQKKKENRVKDVEDLKDPKRWEREDVERVKDISDAGKSIVRDVAELERATRPKAKRLDLSNMTDADLRQRINRMQMEDTYSRLVHERSEDISKGRKYLTKVLEIAGPTLAVTSSALAIAVSIKKLRE